MKYRVLKIIIPILGFGHTYATRLVMAVYATIANHVTVDAPKNRMSIISNVLKSE
jgi:hypothetical protein